MSIGKASMEFRTARASERKLLNDIAKEGHPGGTKRSMFLIQRYLSSYASRLVATRQAFRDLKPHRRPSKSAIPDIASNLRPWAGTQEIVHLNFKGESYRPIMDFGIENKSLQVLVRNVLCLCKTHPFQFATKGGTHHAIETVRKYLLEGYRWTAEIDIRRCFNSFQGDAIPGVLPLPEGVVQSVILSKGFNIPPKCNHYDLHEVDPSLTLSDMPDWIADEFNAARKGIAQGSASSPTVAEILLTGVFHKIPDVGIVVNYADNFLLMAKSKADLVSISETLCGALDAHPAGPLRSRVECEAEPGDMFNFLGHELAYIPNGTVRIAPSPENLWRFNWKFDRKLERISSSDVPPRERAKQRANIRRYVRSWCGAFKLWPGAESHRAKCHLRIAKACPVAK